MVLQSLFGDILPQPGAITGNAARNIIRSTLPRLLTAGYSGNKSLQLYRERGIGIRNSDFFEIQRDILGTTVGANRIMFVRKNNVPSDAILKQDETLLARYRFSGYWEYKDAITQKRVRAGFSIETDEKMEISQIAQELYQAWLQSDSPKGELLSDIVVVRGYINPNL